MWMFTSKHHKINLSTGGKTTYYYYGGYNFIMDSNEENIYFTPYYLNNF